MLRKLSHTLFDRILNLRGIPDEVIVRFCVTYFLLILQIVCAAKKWNKFKVRVIHLSCLVETCYGLATNEENDVVDKNQCLPIQIVGNGSRTKGNKPS